MYVTRNVALLLWCAIALAPADVLAEPVGTAFTYQGQLKEAGKPVNGTYDLRFRLFDDAVLGLQVGEDVFVDDLEVSNGLFTVQLDFGPGIFGGDARWLLLSVRPGDSEDRYTLLSPRQPLTPGPYALHALSGSGGGSGYWTANGSAIYNNNSGRVGIGTGAPNFTLHVFDSGNTDAPPTTLGLQWNRPAIPESWTDWCYFAVGGSTLTVGSGTRFVRKTGTELHFQTRDEMNSGWPSTQMVLDGDGNLGIGTMTPNATLEVVNPGGQTAISASSPYIGVYGIHDGGGSFPGVWGESTSTSSGATAVRGIITSTTPGSGSAGVLGYNKSTTLNGYGVRGVHDGFGIGVYGISQSGIGVYGKSTNGTYAGWFDGRIRTEALEITGADLAEKFPVSEKVAPGMVVAIDSKHPGQLCLARGAYNRCVAGVVSGANDLPAGAVLGHLPGSEDDPAVALSGRVWVRCEADKNPIKPGDLLTTSETPGHAMAVTDYTRAQGAIIGKAMTALDSGRGMVLVLVSLQ